MGCQVEGGILRGQRQQRRSIADSSLGILVLWLGHTQRKLERRLTVCRLPAPPLEKTDEDHNSPNNRTLHLQNGKSSLHQICSTYSWSLDVELTSLLALSACQCVWGEEFGEIEYLELFTADTQ